MVFLVDHHAEAFLLIHDEAAARALGGELAADEVALDEDLFVQRREVIHRGSEVRRKLRQALHSGLDRLEHAEAVGLLGPRREGLLLEVARQPHAAGHDDAVLRAGALAGDRRRSEEFVDGHGRF